MLRIDNSLLQDVGLASLPDSEKNSLLKHIYETLEMRVGVRLASQMSNEQLDEFERYFEAKDDQGAFQWLETNFPNYKDIVQEEFDKLKTEIAQTSTQILSASTAAVGSQSPQPTQQQQAPQPQVNPNPPQNPNPEAYTNTPAPQQTPVPSPPALDYSQPQQPSYPQQPVPINDFAAPPAQAQQYQPPQPPAYPDQGQQQPQNPNYPQQQPYSEPPFPAQQPPAGPAAPNQF